MNVLPSILPRIPHDCPSFFNNFLVGKLFRISASTKHSMKKDARGENVTQKETFEFIECYFELFE